MYYWRQLWGVGSKALLEGGLGRVRKVNALKEGGEGVGSQALIEGELVVGSKVLRRGCRINCITEGV